MHRSSCFKNLTADKLQIRHGLGILTRWAPSSDENTKRKNNNMGAFLEQHILGLVARLSEVVTGADQTISEKKRCVRAMDEMVKLGKTFVRTARPHVCLPANLSL
jgi:serine/threonine-protein kinase ATR